MSKYFEVSALFITFREAFEACIIVSIDRSIINKLKLDNKKQLIRQVYTGVLVIWLYQS
jgi:high-affinity Fe2+/Pb2+ permease